MNGPLTPLRCFMAQAGRTKGSVATAWGALVTKHFFIRFSYPVQIPPKPTLLFSRLCFQVLPGIGLKGPAAGLGAKPVTHSLVNRNQLCLPGLYSHSAYRVNDLSRGCSVRFFKSCHNYYTRIKDGEWPKIPLPMIKGLIPAKGTRPVTHPMTVSSPMMAVPTAIGSTESVFGDNFPGFKLIAESLFIHLSA